MSGVIAYSWRSLRRDWNAGELRVLVLALAVAVASVTAVGFFTDRVRKAMAAEAGELLAADLVVESPQPLPAPFGVEARRLGLLTTETRSFRSVVVAGERVQLAEVKAVAQGYPLKGELRVADQPYGPERSATSIPQPGTVWVEPRLLQQLALQVGDQVGLGARQFTITAVVAYEPDRGGDLFSIAPRVMLNLADLESTALIQTGSLVTYRLLATGGESGLARFSDWVKPRLGPADRVLGAREARPELETAIGRAERFLGLASLVSLFLAGVAVATAARRWAGRHIDSAAVMRCLGAQQRFIANSYALQLLWLGLAAAAVGTVVGFVAQDLLARIVSGLFARELPLPSAVPVVHGLMAALVTLAGFALPPLLALRHVPPLRVLRRDLLPVPPSAALVYGAAVAALLWLMAWQAQDLKLTLLVFAGSAATFALLTLAAWGLVALLRGVRPGTGVAWRFGLAAISRHPRSSVAQMVAFGLGIMVLLLLSLVRNDLLASWRSTLPPDAPNLFAINILPEQVEEVRRFLSESGHSDSPLYPMIRGRLEAINGRAVTAADFEEPRAQRLVQREFNLSWSDTLPPGNRVEEGAWWSGSKGGEEWSVEKGLAETLGIHLGDRLMFRVAGQSVEGRVSSLRGVDWDTFQVNFFVVAPPGVLEGFPTSYITAFYLPPEQRSLPAELVKRFPNITLIDVEAVMERVRSIIDRVVLAVEFVFGFTLAAGLMVLYAAIQATHDERVREAAILRTLGARRSQVLGGLVTEFTALGALAGLLAAAGALLVGYLLADQVFGFAYAPSHAIWWFGVLGGGAGVGLAGVLGTRKVVDQPPIVVLRQG